MKILVQFVRVIVGVLFVFSGFVKLVDPIGSQYKFEEYFSESVLHIPFLIPYALQFSIFLIIAEIVLGVALLVGWKPKFTVKSLLFMVLFFLFLTGYSAYYDKVTDCGCFGDAIKLKPWETFYKDVVLTILIFFLSYKSKLISPFKSKIFPGKVVFWSLVISSFITYYVLAHLPIIDFRPYAIGKNIPQGMEYPEDGSLPKVHDFMLEDAQNDLAPEILKMEKVLLVISYNLDKADFEAFSEIKKVADEAIKKGYKVYGASASFSDVLQLTKKKFDLPFEFLFCDEITLKTMIRANPGVLILNKGTVVDKKNWNDIDDLKLE
ncbi:MAG: DoxX family protein [Flavobacteriia bacterium]|nr:DoxX family protein [Flavobacteriia bacterium]OIP48508.1 MAG: DoxX family protein [Flavobacteriaceae bacterium CG2_30_31_66]PIV97327.1 MAG: DoxX family protein [Flavobacteriaceae bacterium CG17_big_fil_post_rev_8_21_14_2_50_31_13]PIX13499.1 MAG: DoxX family protein [Flavobacteriaceae bacterium CG_4_8_14_3_um_filter_31_8]PIY15012.1 MAG: DoxX family protein [Flavobacteriaceae bacterium CG_4_10_14_3_um_filter_31_253]PIZ09625.1 MAG: DoxX family protein [Flavobacteriaceae bacterium CG_4_10_14_0_